MIDTCTLALHDHERRTATPGSDVGQTIRRRIAELEQVYHLSAGDALAYALAEAEAAAALDTPNR